MYFRPFVEVISYKSYNSIYRWIRAPPCNSFFFVGTKPYPSLRKRSTKDNNTVALAGRDTWTADGESWLRGVFFGRGEREMNGIILD